MNGGNDSKLGDECGIVMADMADMAGNCEYGGLDIDIKNRKRR